MDDHRVEVVDYGVKSPSVWCWGSNRIVSCWASQIRAVTAVTANGSAISLCRILAVFFVPTNLINSYNLGTYCMEGYL